MSTTNIRVDVLARVEGEGELNIKVKGGKIQSLQLGIPEPPRLFEAFLRGRRAEEAVDITARICGICPVAYQMSAAHAIEAAWGVDVHPMNRMLRRLLYCGEYIESHALHVYMLHAPDFLGYQDALEMAGDHRDAVLQALRLKKLGNDIMAAIGGREIHPVSACVGGFHRVIRPSELTRFREELKWAIDASIATAKLVATFPFPEFEQDYEFVSVSHPGEYPLCLGNVVSSRGIDVEPAGYEDVFLEQHVKHSNALHSVIRERGAYHVGPLARFALNYDKLPEIAKQIVGEVRLPVPCKNPFKSIVVRAVELVFACTEALRIIEAYEAPPEARAAYERRAARGAAATEAPRGLLYHRYETDANGLILTSRIVPPTAQNLKRIEEDLWRFLPGIINQPVDKITWQAEQAVRNYDPCISCATHFLKVNLQREE
jgi:coenzyme F420-reducing hydrogenase alpha subunit